MPEKNVSVPYSSDLSGKTAVITGATGGLGGALCRSILSSGGRLILLNRSSAKSDALQKNLLEEYPGADIRYYTADLSDIDSVRRICNILEKASIDFLIHNAGAYALPPQKCSTGYDSIFQINFLSPYYMTKRLLPSLARQHGKVIVVGSIAHSFVKRDPDNIDFSRHRMASRVYGNSKRYLMFSLAELLKNKTDVQLSIAHPGISFTNITSHYPNFLRKLIKWPMKLIFMKPETASRSIMQAILKPVPFLHWIGPGILNIWGSPAVNKLKTCGEQERTEIFQDAESIFQAILSEESALKSKAENGPA